MDEQAEILRAIWSEMKALNGRVTTTHSKLEDLASEVTGVKAGLTELSTEVNGLRSGLNELKTDVTELKADMNAVKSDVTGLKADVDGIKVDVGGIKAEMTGLREDIGLVHRRSVDRDLRLGTSLMELSLDVRELTLVIHGWHDEQRLDRADLHGRVERLEKHVGLEPR